MTMNVTPAPAHHTESTDRVIDGQSYSATYLDNLRKNAPLTYYVLTTGL